ncbi:unnamed protein product [Diatraea saccharalis]|uniref:Histone acetyltransferase type B catalytic subunit n=1 Tax=Diatraea saccharalis TaxID=40085 RepID=A0A9N9RBB7_9NEOP|nr:unnamed protein product [Diatraea saccharalis]
MTDTLCHLVVDGNDVLEFKLVREPADLENDSTSFAPEMCHQVFGENENIFGYTDLRIRLYYSAGSLQTYLGIEYADKVGYVDVIAKTIDESQPKEQAGFRAGFSTTDHIQTLDQIMEKYKEFSRNLYVAFIDYSKAFDSISHSAIWNALSQLNVEQKYINILKNIYVKSTSRIKLETKGDEIKIERGVRQGDPLSPKIFIAVLECIFRNLNWEKKGISLEGCKLNHLRFADDIVLMAETAKELEELIQQLNNESTKVGLHMNASKTKIMTNSHQVPIKLEGKNIDYVNQYIYLGKQMSFSKSNNVEEVERRIGITWRRFWSLKEILKGNYNINLKKIVLDTCILPSLLYGCQTWTLTDKIKRKIRTTQRATERSILKIKKVHKIRSETIRERTGVRDALTMALKLKWKWAGHVARYNDKRWTLIATRWRGPTGKRNVGRPFKRWKDDIVETAGKDWLLKAKDRGKWDKLEEAFTLRGVEPSNSDGMKADDVEGALKKVLAPGYVTNLDQFVSMVEKDKTFTPNGRLLHAFTTTSREGGEKRTFEVYFCETSTPGFLQFHERLQTFLLWYVDAASFIDVDDDQWTFFTVFEKYQSSEGNTCYATAAYATVYRYYAYPRHSRPRISQVLTLPPFRKLGLCASLLQAIYSHFTILPDVIDITVEDPSQDFQRIRDYVDAKNCQTLPAFQPEKLIQGFSSEMANQACEKFKINKKQARRIYEILRLKNTNRSDKNAYFKYRLDVKNRLNAPFQKKKLEMKKLEKVLKPEEYAATVSTSGANETQGRLSAQYGTLEEDYLRVIHRMEHD